MSVFKLGWRGIVKGHSKFQMAKSGKRGLREVQYTGKYRLRDVVFFSGPQQYKWCVEVLRKTNNEGDRSFYDVIMLDDHVKRIATKSIEKYRQ